MIIILQGRQSMFLKQILGKIYKHTKNHTSKNLHAVLILKFLWGHLSHHNMKMIPLYV